MEERVARFIQSNAGPAVELRHFERIPGGYSQETYAVSIAGGDSPAELILRRRPESGGLLGSDLVQEFRLLSSLHSAGYAVPQPLWLDADGAFLGSQGFLMERVPGESKPEPLFEPSRAAGLAAVANDLTDELARIHGVDESVLADAGLAVPPDWEEYVRGRIGQVEAIWKGTRTEGAPGFAETFRWLRRNLPEPMPLGLVHGDYQLGNIIFGDDGVHAVIDWELAHVGDPREDLGWLQVMVGLIGYDFTPAVEGGFIERYRERSGLDVTPEGVLFFQILQGVAVTASALPYWKSFVEGRHRDLMVPYQSAAVLRGTRVQYEAMGMSWDRLGRGERP